MKKNVLTKYPVKKTLLVFAIILTAVALYLVYSLGGIGARPISYSSPPQFVAEYSNQFTQPNHKEVSTVQSKSSKLTENIEPEKQLIREVFFEGKPYDKIIPLFSQPDRTGRIKIAAAYAAVNAEFTHNEESGFPQKKEQFYEVAKNDLPDIENALFEALIASAEENTGNYIPYTIAWLPTQDKETVEILYWSAEHHPHWWIRRFSLYFIVQFGENESYAANLMNNLVHDPDYRVRKEVFDLKLRRLNEFIFGPDET